MFASLHLPDLPVIAALRAFPASRGRPCAVLPLDPEAMVEKVKLPLLAVNDAARDTGIDAGWPLNRALVRCPDLRVLDPHPEGEAELLRELIALAESLTPDLEITARDTLLLDLSRATPRQAAAIAWLEVSDGELRHVRAATPDLARLAVRHPACHGKVVSAADMQALPLELLGRLPEGAKWLPLLEDWGLKRLGDFMELPRQSLIERLGPVAGGWHDLLHGKTCRMLRLHRAPECLEQALDFEEPVVSSEPLVFVFKRLLHTLAARLAARHVAVKALRVRFHLESGASLAKVIRLPEPRVAEAELLRPLQVMLDGLRLKAAVAGVALDVETTLPSAAQRDWFIRQLPQPERWTDTLAQLEVLLGAGRTGIPVPPSGHRPDDFKLLPGDGGGVPVADGAFPACPVPLRRFRPPYEVTVAFEAGPRPLALLSGPFRGEILEQRGPFRQSGDWWDPERSWQRMEWDVRLAGVKLLRLAYLPPERWEVEGEYE
ncbi:DNA polymerase Y family protein [Luteolibacter marinus]|uniref:DNA polymerase Y family protein n=1 Tax=Luteolibacter marinus TaxID=2776705 RepID=UPI0018676A73|nr:DNA polymerase Y family protein [Luteolibacter marinus]